ncbi:hypothetical protein [Candidatus Electronema sp. PJ]|uniref:hypothetical protein n=1 Tax=Candidatus Electronema sp. PJ TaxID=3401572 RepID=UPI003AA8384B
MLIGSQAWTNLPQAFSRVILSVICKNFVISRLNEQRATEKHLNVVLSSQRWRIGQFVAMSSWQLKAWLA